MSHLTQTPLRLAIRTQQQFTRARALLTHRWELLMAEPESGMEDVPWKMIFLIAGGVVAVGIVTAVVAYVHSQLAQMATTPSY